MGPTPTLSPHPQPPSTSHHRPTQWPGRNVDRDLVSDVDPAPATDPERDGEPALGAAAVRLHRELEADSAVRSAVEPEPLGRRLPEPLTSREGVER
jgi:hypothetical protein